MAFFDPFRWTDPRAQQLRKVLASTYVSGRDSRQILSEVGVDETRIDLDQPSTTRWFSAIDEADKSGLLRDLVAHILDAQGPRSKHATFLRSLLDDQPSMIDPEPTGRDGRPSFIDGDDSVQKPEALLYLDDLTLSTGRLPSLIATLQRLVVLAPAVCRLDVAVGASHQFGTAFRIGDDLLLTNWHVLHDKDARRASTVTAEFAYEYDAAEAAIAPVVYACDAGSIIGERDDDWAVIRAATPLDARWPVISLRNAAKATISDAAFIVQHPQGGRKRVGFVRNTVTNVTDRVVHYLTDTEEGSSGAPVFNGKGELIALHHAGGRPVEMLGRPPVKKNEGIRIERIVKALEAAAVALP